MLQAYLIFVLSVQHMTAKRSFGIPHEMLIATLLVSPFYSSCLVRPNNYRHGFHSE